MEVFSYELEGQCHSFTLFIQALERRASPIHLEAASVA